MIRRTYWFSKLFRQKGQTMKKYSSLLYCLLFCTLFTRTTHDTKPAHDTNKNNAYAPYMPIKFTQTGVNSFFKDTLNTSRYRQEVLPNNFSHMVQFIEHGHKRRQGRAYTQSILRLFNNVLKGSMYINAYAFNDFIQQITPLLHKQCTPGYLDPAKIMKKRINDILYANFLNKFDQFKQDPDSFFDGISGDIAICTQDPALLPGDISCQELRKTLMSFFEHGIGKLVWSPENGMQTWKNVKDLAQSLEALLDQKIFTDEDDLNDLFISLVERYALFLDINAPFIPIDCYQEIKKEVIAQNLYFLELDEQESFLEKKSHRMMHALMESEAKARASEYGIVVS